MFADRLTHSLRDLLDIPAWVRIENRAHRVGTGLPLRRAVQRPIDAVRLDPLRTCLASRLLSNIDARGP